MRKLIPPKSPFDINPDSLIYSDLHLHERKEFDKVDPITGLNSRLVEGLNILDQMISILEQHPNIIHMFNLGDFFELKDRVPNHLLIEFQARMDRIKMLNRINYFALLGNHDYNIPNYPIAELFNISIITEPRIIPFSHIRIGFIPYQRDEKDFLRHLISMNKMKPSVIFFHQEIPGAEYESGRKVTGVFPKVFEQEITYISGHIHRTQKVGKVLFVGSPYQVRFSDENQDRYVWLFNSKTKQIASLELKYPKFISIDLRTWEDDRMELGFVRDCYVKVCGEVTPDEWGMDRKREIKGILEEAGARGISFQVQIKRHHQTKIPDDKIEDDDSIIRLYVDNSESGLNPEKLVNVGLDIFHGN